MIKRRPLLAAPLVPTLLWVGTAAALPASKDAAPVVGTRPATGMSYATAVRLAHQPAAADNGRTLIATEDGVPIVAAQRVGDVAGRSHVLVTNPAHPLDDDDLDIVAGTP